MTRRSPQSYRTLSFRKKGLLVAMDKDTEERPRVMFSFFEKQLLLKLIEKYKDIIEIKDLNKIAWSRKNEAFMNIQKEFNRTPGVVRRSAQQLRQCYFNLKKRISKQASRGIVIPEISQQTQISFEYESITPVLEASASSESNCSFVEIKQEPEDDSTETPCVPSVVYVTSADTVEKSSSPQPKTQFSQARISTAIMPAFCQPAVTPEPLPPRPALALSERKASVKAAKAILEENMKINLDKLKFEREEKEHLLRMKLLESQIAVQEKILDLLRTNPSSINLVLSGN